MPHSTVLHFLHTRDALPRRMSPWTECPANSSKTMRFTTGQQVFASLDWARLSSVWCLIQHVTASGWCVSTCMHSPALAWQYTYPWWNMEESGGHTALELQCSHHATGSTGTSGELPRAGNWAEAQERTIGCHECHRLWVLTKLIHIFTNPPISYASLRNLLKFSTS